jgi:hypothetical protein
VEVQGSGQGGKFLDGKDSLFDDEFEKSLLLFFCVGDSFDSMD